MRAIATKNYNKGVMELYVAPFSSKPVLHIKEVNKAPYALTFADAVSRYGASLDDDDLGEAYRRAGRGFDRQLAQIFVVLKEDSNKLRVFPARGLKRGSGYGGRGRGADRGRGGQPGGYSRGRGYSGGQAERGTTRFFDDQAQNRGQNSSNSKKKASRGYGVAKN